LFRKELEKFKGMKKILMPLISIYAYHPGFCKRFGLVIKSVAGMG
jgi:hypothetical protein